MAKIAEDPQSASCPNISYINTPGPVASAHPTGSPYAIVMHPSGGAGSAGTGVGGASTGMGHTVSGAGGGVAGTSEPVGGAAAAAAAAAAALAGVGGMSGVGMGPGVIRLHHPSPMHHPHYHHHHAPSHGPHSIMGPHASHSLTAGATHGPPPPPPPTVPGRSVHHFPRGPSDIGIQGPGTFHLEPGATAFGLVGPPGLLACYQQPQLMPTLGAARQQPGFQHLAPLQLAQATMLGGVGGTGNGVGDSGSPDSAAYATTDTAFLLASYYAAAAAAAAATATSAASTGIGGQVGLSDSSPPPCSLAGLAGEATSSGTMGLGIGLPAQTGPSSAEVLASGVATTTTVMTSKMVTSSAPLGSGGQGISGGIVEGVGNGGGARSSPSPTYQLAGQAGFPIGFLTQLLSSGQQPQQHYPHPPHQQQRHQTHQQLLLQQQAQASSAMAAAAATAPSGTAGLPSGAQPPTGLVLAPSPSGSSLLPDNQLLAAAMAAAVAGGTPGSTSMLQPAAHSLPSGLGTGLMPHAQPPPIATCQPTCPPPVSWPGSTATPALDILAGGHVGGGSLAHLRPSLGARPGSAGPELGTLAPQPSGFLSSGPPPGYLSGSYLSPTDGLPTGLFYHLVPAPGPSAPVTGLLPAPSAGAAHGAGAESSAGTAPLFASTLPLSLPQSHSLQQKQFQQQHQHLQALAQVQQPGRQHIQQHQQHHQLRHQHHLQAPHSLHPLHMHQQQPHHQQPPPLVQQALQQQPVFVSTRSPEQSATQFTTFTFEDLTAAAQMAYATAMPARFGERHILYLISP
ncbi:unnamed protein product [Protopolystoma xenopodis]|uniref:Uncharacterized protein n=1 Tax=Protopolystoma xenopodis TaxID=117903 RepID=A0A3S5B2M5_9PLAT|nr:unnamed protein product [Protopolystoma xenopodis]